MIEGGHLPAVLLSGDSSIGYGIMEFDTAFKHALPFVAVVASDGAWGIVRHPQIQRYGLERAVATDLREVPYHRIVEVMGGHSEYVETPADLRPALERARRAAEGGTPALVNVKTQFINSLTFARKNEIRPQLEEIRMNADFPSSDMELTHILVVREMGPSRSFYRDILGAAVVREYGGTSCVLNFQGSWLLLVTGGKPTEDKPDVTFASPQDFRNVSHAMTIRVPDCQRAYEVLKSRGAEIRCFFRDPDGHLLEISQAV